MQEDNAKKITYGAMMIAFFAILLAISFYIPVLGTITMFYIPLPLILYRIRNDRASSILIMFTGIVLSLLIGGIYLVPFAVVFGILGIVIGDTIKLRKTKLYTFMASGLTILIISVIMYVGAVLFLKFNFIEEIMRIMQVARQDVLAFFETYGGELPANFKEQLDASIAFYQAAIPSVFIIGVFSFAFIFVSLNMHAVQRLGNNVVKFPPFREMKLPMITVWYYLLVLLAGFLFEMEQGSNANLIYVNASIVLRFLFFLQGISFIHYFMNEKKLPRWLAFIATIFALILHPITIIIGILDSGIGIRTWIKKDKTK
ncbi:YybS family protein [Sporosarcina siberiensis]|uniref:YybS family protein n=1 Tax=Sporosarcina siberiensis TaxID=1365606 RepID=A0ABW4SFV0_9BACL